VWSALTDEERAILLERYTIGVPAGGVVTSADQELRALLNCVSNRRARLFRNAAIMPFSIPPQVAASMEVTSTRRPDALLRFHRQSFQPPRSSITLPAKGTLGEAVLGACASAEKIVFDALLELAGFTKRYRRCYPTIGVPTRAVSAGR
jgi:hypothetical protein